MLKQLLGKAPLQVWVIKQIDDDLLHLCGQGITQANEKRKTVLAELENGSYSGPVCMNGGGIVLVASLFKALVPVEALHLLPDGQAHWQGRDWLISQVPQRCWAYKGLLIANASPLDGSGLVSSEDVSKIRHRVGQESPKQGSPRESRPGMTREWRKDWHED